MFRYQGFADETQAVLGLGAQDIANYYNVVPRDAGSERIIPLGCRAEEIAYGLKRLAFGFSWRYPSLPNGHPNPYRLLICGATVNDRAPVEVVFDLFTAASGWEMLLLRIEINAASTHFRHILSAEEILKLSAGKEWRLPVLPRLRGKLLLVHHCKALNDRRLLFLLEDETIPDWAIVEREWPVTSAEGYKRIREAVYAEKEAADAHKRALKVLTAAESQLEV